MKYEPYVLLIATGQSPQVITETIWSYAFQHRPAMGPSSVEVITTSIGEAYARARLLGEAVQHPVTGADLPDVQDRWTPFCRDVLGLDVPVPLHFHVPRVHGYALSDVLSVQDDEQFANLCYERVAELTEAGRPPVVGSIAGGRKTMSAHLMTAFSVYARPEDRLSHVLVYPEAVMADFFYPTTETPDYVRVHRVDIPFPRLQGLLAQGVLRDLPDGRRDLRSLLDALEPHLVREQTPSAVNIHLGDREAIVEMYDDEGSLLDSCRLTANQAGIFVAVAEALQAGCGRARMDDLFTEEAAGAASHPVHRRRLLVQGYCNSLPNSVAAWQCADDVSKALSRLNKALSSVPIVARYLTVESERLPEATFYRWAEPLPAPLTFTCEVPVQEWPFRHLPAPDLRPAS